MWTGTWKDSQPRFELIVDKEKAALHGISAAQVSGALELALSGKQTGLLHKPREKEDVPIILQLPLKDRAGIEKLDLIKVSGAANRLVPLSELVLAKKRNQIAAFTIKI